MKALIIFNPTAGVLAKSDVKGLVTARLQSLGYQPDVLVLDFDFESKMETYNTDGLRLIVAVGGDGTVKVAAREIIQRKLAVPLAIIPFGSANVLASTLGLPLDMFDALGLLQGMKTKKIDVGVINRQIYFIVGFSLGYVSSIIIHTEKDLKNRFGYLGYLFKFLWNKIRIFRIKFRIETQNKVFWVRGNSLIIFNAFKFFGLEPKKPVSITDGILNLYIVTNKTFLTLLQAALGVLFYVKPPRHIFTLDNRYFKIRVKRRHLKTAQVDGDRIKAPKVMEVECLPQALEVVVK
ncbi:MAG: diacylglycerol kinase family protein [Patescibacteria group bacterium]|jgi:diacylglycerol kinase family enzyme